MGMGCMLARFGLGHTTFVLALLSDNVYVTTVSGPGDSLRFRVFGMTIQTFSGQAGDVRSMAFSSNGTLAVTGHWNGTAKLWSVAAGRHLRTFKGHTGVVLSVALAPDGARLLTGSSDSTARLWDVASGEELHVLAGHAGWVVCVAFGPDGSAVLTGPARAELL
mmetsp:Transcript_82053/g.227534  ORF Transcript_82053/g.227534 Transcript_82053/m.227534 type:complete len:164 (+) Transcript_82053:69-560(+)